MSARAFRNKSPRSRLHERARVISVSFIERQQHDIIERILRHCDLWEGPIRTLANSRGPPSDQDRDPDAPRELQLVLDLEFL
jgi:hypothetical protein